MNIKRVKNFLGRKEVKLFFTFLIIYIYFINWYGWNEESNFALTKAIVEENRFEIDSYHNLTGDRSAYQEHYYSDKGPGLPFLAVPAYAAWKLIYYNVFPKSFINSYEGVSDYITTFHEEVPIYTYLDPGFFVLSSMFLVTVFTSSVFTALTAILVYKMSTKIVKKKRYRIAATIVYALGTLAFPYALHFMSHGASAFFAFFSFYLLFDMRISKKSVVKTVAYKKKFLLPGLFIGFAAVVENFLILIMPLFLIYALALSIKDSYKKGFLLFFIALIIGVLPLALYNYTIFGNPLEFSGSHIDRKIYRSAYAETTFGFSSLDQKNNVINTNDINSQQFVKYSFFSSLEWLFRYFHLIPKINFYVVLRLLFYPYRGLIFYSPILLCSLVGFYWMFKKYKLEPIFIGLLVLSLSSIISMRVNWWGGYCFGARYLTVVVPFLIVPMLYAFERFSSKSASLLIFLLIVLSIFINFLGLQPAEDSAYDWRIMYMRSDWFEKQNSFQIFYNPLIEHYWPNFWKTGPRSPLFENLINRYISIDTRMPALSKGPNFPFSEVHIPFFCLVPLFIIVYLIWKEEVKNSIYRLYKKL